VRHPQVLAPEQQRVGPAVQRLAGPAADLVTGRVAGDRRRDERNNQQRQAEIAPRGKQSCRDEQRVARQEEAEQ